MGERKGTNKYYPPDFDPSKHRSLDAYHGTHALRERAKKIKQGILVIRFEMPYNIWCGGCGRHVAMGVRYNAEKKKVGMYYSTPVYEFNMKCHLCDQRYLIRTDPGNYDYVIVSGARRKEQRWDPTETRQIIPDSGETKRRLATDAMFRLEYGKSDETRGSAEGPRLEALVAAADDRHAEDVRLNRLVRAGLRDERKRLAAAAEVDAGLLARHSLAGGSVELLPEVEGDSVSARLLRLGSVVPVAASSALDSDDGCPAFKTARPAEPEELRRRTGATRRMMGIVVASTATSAACSSSSSSSSSNSNSRRDSSATSPREALSATSPKEALSATSPMAFLSATSQTNDLSATSQTNDLSATSQTNDLSATSQTNDLSATSPLMDLSATSPMMDLSATSPMMDLSATSAMKDLPSVSTDDLSTSSPVEAGLSTMYPTMPAGVEGCGVLGLVQYSATPSPSSSPGSSDEDNVETVE